jgi:hypothetical protein
MKTKLRIMKNNTQVIPLFPPFPLKAIKSTSQSSNDDGDDKIKITGRLRFLPAVKSFSSKKISINKIKLPKDVEPPDENWFNNYE